MRSRTATADARHSFWLHVRRFAVPPSMIDSATARRRVGDWAGACAAAHIDVDLDLPAVSRGYGREVAARIRADLRHLAPDLLRWHMPRIGPDGLLRPGLTISLARYAAAEDRDDSGTLQLVVRTPPRWADAGQRISLALWDSSRPKAWRCQYPHPRPHRRFRLDLHRHLWDVRRAGELRPRSGVERDTPLAGPPAVDTDPLRAALRAHGGDVDRWAAEAAILLRAEGLTGSAVTVRCGRCRLALDPDAGDAPAVTRIGPAARGRRLPVLPDAATWVLPDLELLRSGTIDVERLHPLVAAALAPDRPPVAPPHSREEARHPVQVRCRGAPHRIGIVDGVLTPLDHSPEELRRERLLATLTGTPLPCLRAIDGVHRHPDRLADIRARLRHGDLAGALAEVDRLLGPDAAIPAGPLRDELEAAARRQVAHGLFRTGVAARLTGTPLVSIPTTNPEVIAHSYPDRHRRR